MKTIILSDVNSKSDSIIPYGLRLARAMESEVLVLHIVDTRTHQADYSPFSDSQSITPGDTHSHDEIVTRETNKANLALDKLLSQETSRLNYPLKVTRSIKTNSVEQELTNQAADNPEHLFVINSEADDSMFHSQSDILNTLKNTGVTAILVHPGTKFNEFKKILLPANFESEKADTFTDIKFLIEHFNIMIDAVSVAKKNNYIDLEAKAGVWKKIAEDYFLDETPLKTNILEGDNFVRTITGYIKKNSHDLVVLFQQKKHSIKNIVLRDDLDAILKNLSIPALVSFHT